MPKFQIRKVATNENDGFNKTLKYYVMHQANVLTNHNKFYLLELQKHPDGRFRIFTHYGRLGISNIYEVRDMTDGSPVYDEQVAMNEFEHIHEKKLRGKSAVDPDTGQKVREAYVDVDVVSPQVGSVNIRGVSGKTITIVNKKSAIDTSGYDPRVAKLLDQLIEENIHSITSSTSIRYIAGNFSTELGPVLPAHVDKARIPLNDLNKIMGNTGRADPSNKEVQRLNSLYFSLIPKPFSRKITEEDMILDANKLQAEFDILDQLATGVQMGSAMAGNAQQKMNALGTDIEFLEDLDEVKRIKKWIRESKADNHRGTDVWGYDVKTIYKIQIPEERSRYEGSLKRYGNVKEIAHGSKNFNILSILKNGLIIPPSSAGHVTGRAFGDGIYGAINSTKSMNYSSGYWDGKKNKYSNIFLFLADFALGRTYECYSGTWRRAPHGYDSTWAKKGHGLYNDEIIVYSVNQCTLKYLIELVK